MCRRGSPHKFVWHEEFLSILCCSTREVAFPNASYLGAGSWLRLLPESTNQRCIGTYLRSGKKVVRIAHPDITSSDLLLEVDSSTEQGQSRIAPARKKKGKRGIAKGGCPNVEALPICRPVRWQEPTSSSSFPDLPSTLPTYTCTSFEQSIHAHTCLHMYFGLEG